MSKITKLLCLLTCLGCGTAIQSKIRMYAVCSPSHDILLNDWYLPTIVDDYELIVNRFEQVCKTGKFESAGWCKAMMAKVDTIIEAIELGMKDGQEEWFVFSDVDIQYFRPMHDELAKAMKGHDMAFQRSEPRDPRICAGFFACRSNEKTLKLWRDVKAYMEAHPKVPDQNALNRLLRIGTRIKANTYDISWRYLPSTFATGGYWNIFQCPKEKKFPKNLILHHAVRVIGIPAKIKQLRYVRDYIAPGYVPPSRKPKDSEE